MGLKSFFIDTSRCTACRGCQIACKQWNELPATKTKNWGSYQNPKDLSFYTYKLVRMNEVEKGDKVAWYFFPDQCRHCLEPPCKEAADAQVKGAIIKDKATGAVLYDPELTKKLDFQSIRDACPYDIPRKDPKTGSIAKCTMCIDRVSNGLLPACVKTCPTGAMNFGERDEMLKLAQKRLKEVKAKYPKAQVLGADEVQVIYLVLDEPSLYHKFASSEGAIGITRNLALKRLFRPLADAVPIVNA